MAGVVGLYRRDLPVLREALADSRTWLESLAIEGDSPVYEIRGGILGRVPEYGGTRETLSESGRTIFQG